MPAMAERVKRLVTTIRFFCANAERQIPLSGGGRDQDVGLLHGHPRKDVRSISSVLLTLAWCLHFLPFSL